MHEPCPRSILLSATSITITCPQSEKILPFKSHFLFNPSLPLTYLTIPTQSQPIFCFSMTNGFHSGNLSNTFGAFFEAWLVRQEHYLDELLSAQQRFSEARDEDLRDLVSRVLLHYQQYYDEKSRIARRDVFLMFSPPWFTSLEKTLLWIAGYKPGLAFRLITESVPDLSDGQQVRMARLMEETRVEERTLNDKLAKIHESVGAPAFVEAARRRCGGSNGEVAEDEAAIDSLKSALEAVLENANFLRTTLATKMVEILSPAQAVTFLAAAAQFQLKIRSLGLERDAEKQRELSGGGGSPIGNFFK